MAQHLVARSAKRLVRMADLHRFSVHSTAQHGIAEHSTTLGYSVARRIVARCARRLVRMADLHRPRSKTGAELTWHSTA